MDTTQCMRGRKVYIEVDAHFGADGKIMPRVVYWEGVRFEIDEINDIRHRPVFCTGGAGVRYGCKIRGRQKHIFYGDEGKWFVQYKS